MAAGDLVTRDFQMEFNNLLLGAATPYGWQNLQGWDDLPDVDIGLVHQPLQHGAQAGPPYARERVLTWEFQMWPNRVDFAAARAAIRRATAPRRDGVLQPLVISTVEETHLVFAVCTKRNIPADRRYAARIPKGILQFIAPDSRRFSVAESTVRIDAPTGVTGLQYPLTYPLDYGGTVTPGSSNALNEGDTETHPLIEISGPCINPKVTNQALGSFLAFNITLALGEVLTVDTNKGTVFLGSTDKFDTRVGLSVPPEDFVLIPGFNGLVFETPGFSVGAGVNVTWRSAWM